MGIHKKEQRSPRKRKVPFKIIPGAALGLTSPSATCILESNLVKISLSDGLDYVKFIKSADAEQNRLCNFIKSADAEQKRQGAAFVCSHNSKEHTILGFHPHTNDPCVDLKTAQKIATKVHCPSNKSAHRIDILDADKCDAHLASAVWANGRELDQSVRRYFGYDETQWFEGKAMNILEIAYRRVLSHPELKNCSKESASGMYAEAGFGSTWGAQNKSFDARTAASLRRDGARLSYLRHPVFSSGIEEAMGEALGILNIFLKERAPDLFGSMQNYSEFVPESAAFARGHRFPSPPKRGVLKGAPAMNSSQIALRMVGCPRGASLEYLNRTCRGGSGLHVDDMDPKSPLGFATIYLCFLDKEGKETVLTLFPWRRPLMFCDLLVFQGKNGGRAAQIETMKLGYVCIVYHHSSDHLHGSVFPDGGKKEELIAGLEGMKIVCYQTKAINKIARNLTVDRSLFTRYLKAHNEFLEQLQEKGPGKHRIACCHLVVIARVLLEYKRILMGCHGYREDAILDKTVHDHDDSIQILFTECKELVEYCSWCPSFISQVKKE